MEGYLNDRFELPAKHCDECFATPFLIVSFGLLFGG